MSNYNKVIIIGRLTADPILSYTPAGKAVTKFSLAINSHFTNKDGEKKESVDFVPVTVWDRQAESSAEFLKKAKLVLVEGRLKQDKWTDKEGKKRSSLSITANFVRYLTAGKSESEAPAKAQAKAQAQDYEPAQDHAEQNLPEDQADEHCPF